MSRLHYAARRGLTDELIAGIKAGLDLNERSAHHFTPLHLAAQEGQTECAAALIAAGADTSAAHPNKRTALHFAASSGHLGVVRALVESGVPVDVGEGRTTPALEAAMFNHVEVARYLLDRGANPEAQRMARTVVQWLEVGGIQGTLEGPTPRRSPQMLAKIRNMMKTASSVEEYAAYFGRTTAIFSYPLMDLSADPEADAWAGRFYEILGQPELLAECEDRFLEGDELAEVQAIRERHRKASERRAERGR